MPKARWGISSDEPEDYEPFAVYDGPEVPGGVYKVVVPRVALKVNRNGDDMLFIVSRIAEDRREKKQYNGATVMTNQNVTDQGAPYLKMFLRSLGVSWSDFWNRTTLEPGDKNDDKGVLVAQIGRVKFANEPEARMQIKIGSYNEERQLQVAQWLPPSDDDDDDDADEPADGGEPEPDDDSDPFA